MRRETSGNGLNRTERLVAKWLEISTLKGFAVFNVNVVDRDAATKGRRDSQQIDAIVWTPEGCVVLEVKGFERAQSGVLDTSSLNDVWTVNGEPAAFYTRGKDANPSEQAKAGCLNVKNRLFPEAHDGQTGASWIRGLVVVLPHPKSTVECDRTANPYDPISVAFCPPRTDRRSPGNPLRQYFHNLRDWNTPVLTASDVLSGLDRLDLKEVAPEYKDLLAHGLPEIISAARPTIATKATPPPSATGRPRPTTAAQRQPPTPQPTQVAYGTPAGWYQQNAHSPTYAPWLLGSNEKLGASRRIVQPAHAAETR